MLRRPLPRPLLLLRRTVLRFYPLEKAALDARLQASLATVTDHSEAKNEGIELGRTVAEQVLERSRSDRYDVPALPYVPAPTHGRGNSRLRRKLGFAHAQRHARV